MRAVGRSPRGGSRRAAADARHRGPHRAGCFRCLEQALALADQRNQSQLAFEAAALLVLRATELGMPADPWMARARALAEGDPVRTQYLEMVAAVPPDPLRGLRDDLLVETQGRNRARSLLPSWYDVVADRLALAVVPAVSRGRR